MLQNVTIRMYCTGFGDCFLLTFKQADGTAKRMLIDFGVRGGEAEQMQAIARHLKDKGLDKNPLDYLVITHEHEDHISGFRQAKDIIEKIDIRELWLGWTEKSDYNAADDWKRYKEQTRTTLRQAFTQLPDDERAEMGMDHKQGSLLGELLRFEQDVDDDDGESAGQHSNPIYNRLIDRIKKAGGETRYCTFGEHYEVIPGVRIYVLGPPPIQDIRRGESHTQGELYIGADYMADAYSFAKAFEQTKTFAEYVSKAPFDEEYIVPVRLKPGEAHDQLPPNLFDNDDQSREKHQLEQRFQSMKAAGAECVTQLYFDQTNDWRLIGNDWLKAAEGMALKLNQYTNNTSLVLAIELIDTGEVLLFPGDAQYGVWSAWDDDETEARNAQNNKTDYQRKYVWNLPDNKTVTVDDLLKRTVFYKVGHHGSHNATPKRTGLQKMTHKNLCALVPVNAKTAQRYKWNDIPFQNLLKAFGNVPADPVRSGPVTFLRADELDPDDKINWPTILDTSTLKVKSSVDVAVPDSEERKISYVDLVITLPERSPKKKKRT